MAVKLTDIARETGMATSSVADVLRGRPGYSPETRKRILDAAERLNYVPNNLARSLLKQRSNTIGIAAHLSQTSLLGPTLDAIADGLLKRGFMPLICAPSAASEGIKNAIRELRGRSVDGIIFAPNSVDTNFRQIIPVDLPCVLIGDLISSQWPCVISDRAQAIAAGVQWLTKLGHKRIAFLGVGNAEALNSSPNNTTRLKILGYSTAMKRAGLFDESLILDSEDHRPGYVRKYVASNPKLFSNITAILAGNDRIAVEVMGGLADLGLNVPGDCSVLGFDDSEFASAVRPSLTTFDPRRAEVGQFAVNMILDLLDGKPTKSVTLIPRLIERESTRALNV